MTLREKQALLADRQSVSDLIASMDDSDPLGKMSLIARLHEIDAHLALLQQQGDSVQSIALIFGGAPVHGARSIDADFASRVIEEFQDLVAKRVAADEIGQLGSRGPLPLRQPVKLAITDIVRGSVGFLLEERAPNHEIAQTNVGRAMQAVADIIASTSSEVEADFERTMESLDSRLLISLRKFFRTLDDGSATVSLEDDERSSKLDSAAVRRGRRRIDMTEIQEREAEEVTGELIGLLPEGRRFEMRLSDSGEVISGHIAASIGPKYLELIETPDQAPVGRIWRTQMRIREIRELNKPLRKLYTLLGLLERIR